MAQIFCARGTFARNIFEQGTALLRSAGHLLLRIARNKAIIAIPRVLRHRYAKCRGYAPTIARRKAAGGLRQKKSRLFSKLIRILSFRYGSIRNARFGTLCDGTSEN